MSRIGIYGGSFNPPHNGHVFAAEEAIRRLQLDRLLIMPTYQAPHKQQAEGSPDAAARLALVQAAFDPLEKAEVSDLEIARQGVSYTVDTLQTLRRQNPDDALILLMGTDMLLNFPSWRSPEKIAAMATLAVMHRQSESESLHAELTETAKRIEDELGGRVRFVENDCIALSSTEIRRMIAFGVPEFSLPQKVAAEIRRNKLYGFDAPRKNLPFDRLCEVSLALHDEKRRAHVRGCCETAEAMALRWGADPDLMRRAGILHDITKALSGAAQLALCDHYHFPLSDFERSHPKLLHAKSGAVVAREIFGECDTVCDAICWHTTGKPAMTTEEKIIYLADYMEPNRDFPGVERLRALVFEDLDAALKEGLTMSLEILRRRGQPIDEHSRAAWEYMNNSCNPPQTEGQDQPIREEQLT